MFVYLFFFFWSLNHVRHEVLVLDQACIKFKYGAVTNYILFSRPGPANKTNLAIITSKMI